MFNKLVYYEQTGNVIAALAREKEIKKTASREKEHVGRQHEPGMEALSNRL